MAADINLGLGEYLTVYVLGAVILIALLGWFFGVAAGGVFLFGIVGIITVLVIYAVLSRAYAFLLHGDIRAPRGGE